MRFECKITAVKRLLDVVACIYQLRRECQIEFGLGSVTFHSPRMKAVFPIDTFFEDYFLDTPTNTLLLDVGADALLRTLRMIVDDSAIRMSIRSQRTLLSGRQTDVLRINFSSLQTLKTGGEAVAAATFKDVFARPVSEDPLSSLFEGDSSSVTSAPSRSVVVPGDVLTAIGKASARLRYLGKNTTIELVKGGILRVVVAESLVTYSASFSRLHEIVRITAGMENEADNEAPLKVRVTVAARDWFRVLARPEIARTVVLSVTNHCSLDMYLMCGEGLDLDSGYIHYHVGNVYE